MASDSFGTTASGIVPFTILMASRDEGLSVWSDEPNIIVTNIPGSTGPPEIEVIRKQGPSMVTWRLYLATVADYTALKAKQATVDTLTVAMGTQTHSDAQNAIEGFTDVVLPHTLLMRISDEMRMVDGSVEASATFFRQLDSFGEAVPL